MSVMFYVIASTASFVVSCVGFVLIKAWLQKKEVERLNAKIAPIPERKRVAIVGGGVSGLVALSELLADGHDAVVFESSDRVGGVFAHYYRSGQLTSSSNTTTFSRVWHGLDFPTVWKFAGYMEYLDKFVDELQLLPHVELHTKVMSIHRRGPGVVEVTVTKMSEDGSSTTDTRVFNHVVIATGIAESPKMPDLKGKEEFEGEIMHMRNYQNPEPFAGKKVCVIGLGESGSDMSLEIARVAESLAMSTRKGPGWLIPRYAGGLPSDVDTNRAHNSCPRDLKKRFFPQLRWPLLALWDIEEDDQKAFELATDINMRTNGDLRGLERFGTKNLSLVKAMLYHDAMYKPGIDHLTNNKIVFADGSEFECDTIVCATGFKLDFPFLSEYHEDLRKRAVNVRNLYKHSYDPEFGADICWIGYNRPGIGALPPLSEMASRYFSAVVSGRLELPEPMEMKKIIESDRKRNLGFYPRDGMNIPELVDFLTQMNDFGKLLNVYPRMFYLFVYEPWLWFKIWFTSINTMQYRLFGHGRFEWKVLKERFAKLPVGPMPVNVFDMTVSSYAFVTRNLREIIFS